MRKRFKDWGQSKIRSEILHGGSKMSTYTPTFGLSARLSAQNTQRINTISQINKELNATLNQLSTGYKFTSAAENPSGSSELTRLQARIYGVEKAIENNQYSYNSLTGIDSAQNEILKTLMDMRSKVSDATTETDTGVKETLMQSVSAGISAINVFSNSVEVGGKQVLSGDAEFNLSSASGLISTKDSYIRTILDDSYLSISFQNDDAAEQAVISGTFNLPDSGSGGTDSVFEITTSSGTKRIQVNATSPVDNEAKANAVSLMNQQLADIGVYAELNNDGTELNFLTRGYGDSASISFNQVSGTDILTGVSSASDYGETGSVLINGTKYDLKGQYKNDGSESAEVKGEYNNTIATDATITLTTTNGSASYVFSGGDTISGRLTAMNTAFSAIGAEARIDNGKLIFNTTGKGSSEVLMYSNTGTDQIFTDGKDFTDTGRRYENTSGIKTYVTNSQMQSELTFEAEKVGKDLVNNVTLNNQRYSFQPEGGTHFQVSDGGTNIDSINYGFRDISASGLDLEKIVDSSSEFYLVDDPDKALNFLDSVIATVKSEWTGLGSFMKNNLNNQAENLQDQLVSLAKQRSTIADVDEAYATTRITQLQILQQANISALTLGNSTAKMITSLLPTS